MAAPAAAAAAEAPPAEITAELIRAYYSHYCPADLDVVGVVLDSYKGREQLLWERLVAKYGPWPPPGVVLEPPALGRRPSQGYGRKRSTLSVRAADGAPPAAAPAAAPDGAEALAPDAELPDPPRRSRRRRGTVFGSADGLPALYSVQGRALCIGIDYVGLQGVPPPGAGAAAQRVADTLRGCGFQGPVRVLVDNGDVAILPTRARVEEALGWLVSGARPGDGLVLFFAGMLSNFHGTGAVLCADHLTEGHLVGSDLLHRLCDTIPPGARALVIQDGRPVGSCVELPHRLLAHCDGTDEEPRLHQRAASRHAEHQRAEQAAQDRVVVLSMSRPSAGIVATGTQKQQQQSQEECANSSLGDSLITALHELRRPPADPPAATAALPGFLAAVEARYGPEQLRPLVQGCYPARAFAAWPFQSVAELQEELSSWGVPAVRAAPLQNMARAAFGDAGREVGHGAPSLPGGTTDACCSLRDLLYGVRDNVAAQLGPSAAVAPLLEAAVPLQSVLDRPVLPCAGSEWTQREAYGSLGAFPKAPRARAAPGGQGIWQPRVGFISSGGDMLHSPQLMTVQQAIELASQHPECQGFCFEGTDPEPSGPVQIYFKDKFDLSGRGWTTYCRGDPLGLRPETTTVQVETPGVEGQLASMLWRARPQPEVSTPAAPPPRQPDGSRAAPTQTGRPWVDPALRRRLWRFYLYHNPSKLPSVVPCLLAYADRERELFAGLVRKYGPEPPPGYEGGPLPSGWRLAEGTGGELFFKHRDGRKQWERPCLTLDDI
eukprot:TRINITY_DN4926_c0_g1_i1.p1 TRINITY_DN4926_c0_g1~~TRINITY_DN4926_c0_g1_i1.p1  ORF type:complete len:797 (+),score=187.78 TRINITY_DN4926_c0_g1_i1:67-2391(+)